MDRVRTTRGDLDEPQGSRADTAPDARSREENSADRGLSATRSTASASSDSGPTTQHSRSESGSNFRVRLVRESFADAVSWVAKILPNRPTVPITAGILLRAEGDVLTISGYDFEVSAEVQIPAEISSAGAVLVSGRLLSDITRALPNKPVDFYADGNRVTLNCGSARFSLPMMPIEDYPTLPLLPEETGVMASNLFVEAVTQVAIAAGRDDTLPMLTGVRIEMSGDTMVLAATDRFRLAVRELNWPAIAQDIDGAILVPAKNLLEAAKAVMDGSEVRLSMGSSSHVGSDSLLGISGDGKQRTIRLLDAEFPKFRQLMPSEHTALATINVAELTDAIKLVAVVAQRAPQIRMEFSEGSLKLSADGDDRGQSELVLEIDFFGAPLTIAFNPAYLTDGLSSIHTERVSFGFTTPGKPALLRPVSEDDESVSGTGPFPSSDTDYVYLLMPVRLPG